MMNDLEGQKFNRLVVVGYDAVKLRDNQRNIRWICECECGNITIVVGSSLKNLNTTSCGCYNRERSKEVNSQIHRIGLSGANNPAWKGGVSDKNSLIRNSSSMVIWRKAVFERDKYSCQKCGDDRGGNLRAHHIKNFATNESLRTDVNNGITLCENCHIEFHHVYGNRHNNEFQLYEWLYTKGE